MNDKNISFVRISLAISGFFIVLGLISQALSAHLPQYYFETEQHREYLKRSANTLIIQAIGASLISFYPLTPISRPNETKKWFFASNLILIGTFLFSGSLTLLAFGVISRNFITPFGAILQMLGWILPAFICISGMLQKKSL